MANFGHISYGETIIAQVFTPKTNFDACKPFTKEIFNQEGQKAMFENKIDMVVPVVLVERGTCTFVTKVRNVEKAGANAAIIMDNKIEPSRHVIMSDDGSGHTIGIPSFLIPKKTGEALKEFSEEKAQVILKIKIDLKHSEADKANVSLWFADAFELKPYQAKSLGNFLGDKLKSKVDFDLKINTHSCHDCLDYTRANDCVSKGKYCITTKQRHTTFWREK